MFAELIDLHQLLKFLHILGFVLWLGGDLGVYVSARYVANGTLPLDERLRFLSLLMTLDMFPRAMLIAMVPMGIQLGANLALIDVSSTVLQAIWLLAAGWFALMWLAHVREKSPSGKLFKNLDLVVRCAVMVVLAGVGLLSLAGAWPVLAGWLALKVLLFAVVIGLGLMLRGVVARWVTGFGLQASDKAQGDAIISAAHKTGALYARMLWALLILMGLLGTLKPYY
jgi:hypothetical protein